MSVVRWRMSTLMSTSACFGIKPATIRQNVLGSSRAHCSRAAAPNVCQLAARSRKKSSCSLCLLPTGLPFGLPLWPGWNGLPMTRCFEAVVSALLMLDDYHDCDDLASLPASVSFSAPSDTARALQGYHSFYRLGRFWFGAASFFLKQMLRARAVPLSPRA